jgi:hypothetical protein
VALDHVPQHEHVDVAPKQSRPVAGRGALGLVEPALVEVQPEALIERGALSGRQADIRR